MDAEPAAKDPSASSRRAFLGLATSALVACASRSTSLRGSFDRSTPLRVPARMRREAHGKIHPLLYGGGFDAKRAIYETLLRIGPDGGYLPGLASAWSIEDGGRSYEFELRAEARFHDGSPADAEAVCAHMRRWVGLPEHGWIEASDLIRSVESPAPHRLVLRLERPCDLQAELLAINPCGIGAPACFDSKGELVRPIGSGPFRFVEVRDGGGIVRCARFVEGREPRDAGALVDFVTYASDDPRRPIDDLAAGRLDAVIDTWSDAMPRQRVLELRSDPRFRESVGPGGSVTFLAFGLSAGPTAKAPVRRRIRAALDREDLVREVELGFATPCATWAPPTIAHWPSSEIAATEGRQAGPLDTLRFLRQAAPAPDDGPDKHLHESIVRQLAREGIRVELASLPAPEFAAQVERRAYDLLVMRTLGVPYDPGISLGRFLPPPTRPAADSRHRILGDAALTGLVREARASASQAARQAVHARIQAHIDREATVVPLYVAQRVAIVRRELGRPRLDHDVYAMDLEGLLAGGA